MGYFLHSNRITGKKRRLRSIQNSVKEAMDHLPSGICFFDEKGLLLLSNVVMHRLVFALTGHDLQSRLDLDSLFKGSTEQRDFQRDGDVFILEDNGVELC